MSRLLDTGASALVMDLDDLLDGIGSTRPLTPRGQRVARLVFGLVLALLSAAGAYHVATAEGGLAFRGAGVAMFAALALFGLCGIGMGRGVRLFGCLFLFTLAGLFAVRIVFGP